MQFVIEFGFLIAAAFFVFGLKKLTRPQTAKMGNIYSAIGMGIAVFAALLSGNLSWGWIIFGLAVGSFIGVFAAKRVEMTQMPEMVAIFNGLGGLASLTVGLVAVFIGFSLTKFGYAVVGLSILIGGVTATGSVVAWAKLSGKLNTKPLLFPSQQLVNLGILLLAMASVVFLTIFPHWSWVWLLVLFAFGLGVLTVIPIGGADMPVVISLLNSYSGLAASFCGFAIGNNLLIVSGALVGASGIILTSIMCKAMNRSLTNVLFSGFGASTNKTESKVDGEVKSLTPEDAYYLLEAAQSVVIVPGYGMAVAQAQHVIRELTDILAENGTEVKFAIHPVAGRMPGHMNVLLAEANVPYDQLIEMDDINPQMPETDICIVVGANDVVNPAATEDSSSPIYGMPIICAHQAKTVIVLKRSMSSGFAGIENPLFYRDNTRMLFGDAKATVQSLVEQFSS